MNRLVAGIVAALAAFFSGLGPVYADQPLLDLVRVPLAVNAAIPPNVLVTLDDSGSMGWGFLPDGANYGSSDCRRYNSSYNRIYYNPDVVYSPPLRQDGSSFPNASFNNAWIDGFRPGLGTRDLRTQYAVSGDHQGSQDYSSGWITSNFPSSSITQGYARRAFYCTGTHSSTVVLMTDPAQAANRQNFANWFSYYRIRSLAARTALSTAFARLDPSVRVAWQNFYSSASGNRLGPNKHIRALDIPDWESEFFGWLHSPRFSGNTPMNAAFLRAGRYVEDNRGQNTRNPYYDEKYGRELSCRQTFHVMMTDGYGNVWLGDEGIGDYDTAGRANHEGRTLTGPAARIYHNKTTSGSGNDRNPNLADMAFYFWSRDLRPNLSNDVPAFVRNNTTGVIAGATPADEVYFNPANDPATWQRMVNYMVTFGAGGTLPYTNPAQTLRELRTGARQWPKVTGGANTIDDAWHAAVNSRGDFLSADDPQELVDALTSIMENVTSRQAVTAISGSSTFHRRGEYEYQATYDTNDWTGDIVATPLVVDDSGVSAPPWPNSAAGHLDALSDAEINARKIITWKPGPTGPGSGSQANFIWDELSAEQRVHLRFNPETGGFDNEDTARLRVDYIRGQRAQEQDQGGPFRSRESRFGAVVDSNIAYVEAPAQNYFSNPMFPEAGEEYAEFRETYRQRTPMLYVGANDGMLHAINARTGQELWAFVPNKVIRNLSRLTSPSFQFFPTVNGQLETRDVYINGAWRTVLFGTLGLGGQGAFAIDITEPTQPRVLWEIGDEHVGGRLGFNYGRIAVARMKPTSEDDPGRWIAALPSGYNHNSEVDYSIRNMPNARPDPHVSEEGPALFILDVETGAVVRTLDAFPDVQPAAFGLAEVTIAEYGSNFEADFAIGGDLNGNLWRYSLSVEDSAADGRGRAQIERLLVGDPEYPITAAPRVFPDLGNGLVIVGGTGKFLEPDDRERMITPQIVFGVQECLNCDTLEANRNQMVEHELTHVGDGYLGFDRIDVIPAGQRGWFFELGFHGEDGIDLRGERVLDRPEVSFEFGLVFINTYYPSDDPCSPLGGRVSYALNAYSGGYPFSSLSEDGTEWVPSAPVIPDAPPEGVSQCVGDSCNPCPDGNCDPDSPIPDDMLGATPRVDRNGCLVGWGNICITPMRRGWRELPLE